MGPAGPVSGEFPLNLSAWLMYNARSLDRCRSVLGGNQEK